MKILVACEFSGTVRDAFTEKGHYAVSCDLLPSERPGYHYIGDVMDILYQGWDMMIAHPPCTYLSKAGARWLYKNGEIDLKRYGEGLKAKEFFLTLLNSGIPKICVENPIPFKIFELPEKSQVIQPSMFGDPFMKTTYLWLKGLPLLTPTDIVKGESTEKASWFNSCSGETRRKNRSITFQGIAKAMADQWG